MRDQLGEALRLQPEAIPALRKTFGDALAQLSEALYALGGQGYLPGPWLGDETSSQVVAHYTRRAMTDPDSSYHALLAYRDELTRVHDTLQQMEDAYRRGESDEAARWGPRT